MMVIEEDSVYSAGQKQEDTSLSSVLEQVRKCDGVVGYILRNAESAMIALEDTTNLINYALLSSEIFDLTTKLFELFPLGEAESVLAKGDNLKVLGLVLGSNKISVFMKNEANETEVLNKFKSHPS